ncbi:MAG TPA: glycogen synthase, partial [Polyangiaceae bacterium]|nr:glycogen synthase [Polyangiaceae bacterium]
MRVLFVASEMAPWVKVGGLGDVLGSLPPALRALGVDVRVCLPAHAGVLDRAPEPRLVERFEVHHQKGPMLVEVFESRLGDLPVYLISGPTIPRDAAVYSADMGEEAPRFVLFSLAALELAKRLSVDVLHCHDWHAAAATWQLARRREVDPALRGMTSLLTVHNLPYAGHGAAGALYDFGIQATDDDRLPEHLRHTPLGLGLVAADAISTVSRGYAREILTAHYGHGFEHLLSTRREDLYGIMNGLDLARWDPATDPALPAGFSADALAGRRACRRELAHALGLPQDRPIVAVVSRLVSQKGIDVALRALRAVSDRVSVALLGEGDPHLEHEVRSLAAAFPAHVSATIGFDAALARRMYGGADMVLMPSRYEPCGMTQMIGMRYGCVPVACETGGLADTVLDLDLSEAPTGVLFPEPTAAS